MSSKKSQKDNPRHHLWNMKFIMVDHTMPLLRVLLILRKFRVHVVSLDITPYDQKHWQGSAVLDFRLSTRTETVFKKISRFYDIAAFSYCQGEKFNKKKSVELK